MEADLELDCRDMRCPLPIIALANAIGDVSVDHTVAVVTNDPAARADVPAWCRMRGHEYLAQDAAPDGIARFVVRRLH